MNNNEKNPPVQEHKIQHEQKSLPEHSFNSRKQFEKKRKTGRTGNRGTKLFLTIYISVSLVLIAIVGGILLKLNSFLKEYEAGLPKYKAEEIFDMYYSPLDYDFLFEKSKDQISAFENKGKFIQYADDNFTGKTFSFREVSVGMGEEKGYTVYADDTKISKFILVKGEEKDEKGNAWVLDSVETYFSGDRSAKIEALSTSKVYINGNELSSDFIVQKDIPSFSEGHLPEGVPAVTYSDYSVEKLLVEPEIKVIDKNGKESSLILDEEKNIYVEQINYGDVPAELSERIEQAAQTYSKYMTQDASLSNVKKYFDESSKTYFYIRTSETWCYTDHIGYEFKDIQMSEFFRYDENTFSVRYKCTQVVNRTRYESFPFYLDATLYFKNINGTYYVYDMVVV